MCWRLPWPNQSSRSPRSCLIDLFKPPVHLATVLHVFGFQAWTTARCWSRWSEATGCCARRTAPRPCTSWWCSAGRQTRRRGPPLSTCRPFWRTTSLPLSLSTSRGIISEHCCLHLMSFHWLFHQREPDSTYSLSSCGCNDLKSSSTDFLTSKLHTNRDGCCSDSILTIKSKDVLEERRGAEMTEELKMTAMDEREELCCVTCM